MVGKTHIQPYSINLIKGYNCGHNFRYGGIHLGPDRFKHYNNCARQLLQACGYLQIKVSF
jgi:hypothetical protein